MFFIDLVWIISLKNTTVSYTITQTSKYKCIIPRYKNFTIQPRNHRLSKAKYLQNKVLQRPPQTIKRYRFLLKTLKIWNVHPNRHNHNKSNKHNIHILPISIHHQICYRYLFSINFRGPNDLPSSIPLHKAIIQIIRSSDRWKGNFTRKNLFSSKNHRIFAKIYLLKRVQFLVYKEWKNPLCK